MDTVDVIDGVVQTAQPANLNCQPRQQPQLSARSTTSAVNPVNTVQNPTHPTAGELDPLLTRKLNGSIINAGRWYRTSTLKIS